MTRHSDLYAICERLPFLDKKELAEVQVRVSFLLQGSGADNNSDETFILGLICSYLSSSGIDFSSAMMLRKSSSYPPFKQKVPIVLKFFEQCKPSKTELSVLITLGIELLIIDMQKMAIPVSGRMVMSHIHRIPSLINRAFPFYAAAGMLGWIIKRKKSR